MANITNLTSEKSSNFVDGVDDPDLESRLYAEIYYSNESYVTPESELRKDNNDPSTASISTDITCSMPGSFSASGIVDTAVNSVGLTNQNQLQAEAFVLDHRPECQDINQSRTAVRNNLRIDRVPEKREAYNGVEHQTINKGSFRRQRLLAYENLWLTPVAREERQCIDKISNAQIETTENCFTDNCFYNNSNVVRQIKTTVTANGPATRKQSASLTDAARGKRSCKLRKRIQKERKNSCSKYKQFRGTKTIRPISEEANNIDTDTDTSKYKVIGKKNKMTMEVVDMDPVSISSDSDESILEVPVPPKALPPVIHLNDSDEESSKLNEPCTNKNVEKDRSTSESSDSVQLFPSINTCIETRENSTNVTVEPNLSTSHTVTTNLTLNCTEVQHGVANLDEIKQLRQAATIGYTQSDDSMTESEAVNWNNIEAYHIGPAKEKAHYLSDHSANGTDTELWNPLAQANQPVSSVANESQNRTETTAENSTAIATTTLATETVAINSRKRQKSVESNSSKNIQAAATLEKKMKRTSPRSESLTEYFFKPMSMELQRFYNNTWGDDDGDLLDIQSKMPRNPNFWAILDADLRVTPKSRGRKVCPRCRTDSHFGRKCPTKPKKPNCHMCGTSGHTESRCPHTMCLTCGRKYATYRKTCSYCYKLYCTICNGTGHKCDNCPDLWRRYHNTITETKPIVPRNIEDVMKAPQNLTCCNCAKRGHDVTMCVQLRWSQHFLTPINVSSYTEGPMYTTKGPETIGSVNNIPEVEILEILDDDILLDEHTDSVLGHRLLFQSDNASSSVTRYSHRVSLRLDETTNVYLNDLLAGNVKPKFLMLLKRSYEFSVQIISGLGTAIYLTIEANCKDVMHGLEKLIRQWLSRKDSEKTNLEYAKISNKDKIGTISDLYGKLSNMKDLREPSVLLKEIISLKKAMKHNEAVARRRFFNGKARKRGIDRKKSIARLKNLHNLLVASLYIRSYVIGGTETVESFLHLVATVKKSKEFTTKHHFELMYLYNEIFTFRTTEPLSTAFVQIFSKTEQLQLIGPDVDYLNESMRQSSYMTQSISTIDESAEKLVHNDANASNSESPSNNQICPTYYSPLGSQCSNELAARTGQNTSLFTNLDSTDVPHFDDGNNDRGGIVDNSHGTELRPATHFDQATPSFSETIKNNSTRKSRPKNLSNKDALANLTKTARRTLRQSVKQTIKAAKKLQIQPLNEMANVLKRKLYNNCISTSDIESFKKKMLIFQFNQANKKVKSVIRNAKNSQSEQQNMN